MLQPTYTEATVLRDATDQAIADEDSRRDRIYKDPTFLVDFMHEADKGELLVSLLRSLWNPNYDAFDARAEMVRSAEMYVNLRVGE